MSRYQVRTTTSGPRCASARLATLAGLVAVALSIAAVGCGRSETSPIEAQVRAVVDRAEEFAEARDLPGFRDLLSDEYTDDRGNSKESATLLLNYYLSANRSIHLLTRTAQVHIPDSSTAELLVFVAMAGRPIAGVESLGSMRADLHHFFVSVVNEDGEWRIWSARWGRGWDVDGLDGVAPNAPRR